MSKHEKIIVHSEDVNLQSLAIPGGFEVIWNTFFDVLDQGKPIFFEGCDNHFPYDMYRNTLFYAEGYKRGVDMGWAPEIPLDWSLDEEPEGAFWITVIKSTPEQCWTEPLVEFSSRKKDEIVEKLNELMLAISQGKL